MKFSALQENLKQGIFIVNRVATKNINLPILNNILINVGEGEIKFITTNLEMGIINSIRGKIESQGSFTVDSKIISEYIGLLSNKKVDIELRDNSLIIECENYKTKIKGQPADEFPLIPTIDKSFYYSADIEDFKKAISETIFAVSSGSTNIKIELSGVLFSFNKNNLTLASTDSYRLAEKKINIKKNKENEEDNKKIIVPGKTLQELNRILSGKDIEIFENEEKIEKEIKIYISENQIMFTYGSTEIISRLIEGQYPDYKQIIPKNYKTSVVVNKQELIRAVKASSLFSKNGVNDINIDLFPLKGKVVVSSESGQSGEAFTEIKANSSGDDVKVVLNYRYLLDGLNNITSESVKVEVVDGNTPFIIKPEKEENYLYIVMPIRQ